MRSFISQTPRILCNAYLAGSPTRRHSSITEVQYIRLPSQLLLYLPPMSPIILSTRSAFTNHPAHRLRYPTRPNQPPAFLQYDAPIPSSSSPSTTITSTNPSLGNLHEASGHDAIHIAGYHYKATSTTIRTLSRTLDPVVNAVYRNAYGLGPVWPCRWFVAHVIPRIRSN